MIRRMIDSDIGQIMEKISSINGTNLTSFHTPLIDSIPDKEGVRSQLFNYSVAVYGSYENDNLLGLIYYQLPAVVSFQNAATIHWINCIEMKESMFGMLLTESAEDLFCNSSINKIKIHVSNGSYYVGEMEKELSKYGFVKEATIKHGVGWQSDLIVYSLINRI